MANKEKIKQLFNGLQLKLAADLGLSGVHDDPNARGDNSEISWINMLTKHLPSRYRVSAGIVIDCNGDQSDSIDIIIYDSFYSPFIFNDNGVIYIPAESVYAAIECKPELDRGYVEYAANKAASVRKLHRTSLPITQLNGEQIVKKDGGIVAGVVATKSSWSPVFGEPFESALKDFADVSRIDFGCCLNDGAFTAEYADSAVVVTTSTSDDSLISFLVNLVTLLQKMGNVPAIDLKKYYS